jgi:iron complex transport system substrate-binding protein
VLAANERYSSFKAFQEGHVYNNNARVNQQAANDYWEMGIVEPHILLADLIKILHPELLPNHRLQYYRRLK